MSRTKAQVLPSMPPLEAAEGTARQPTLRPRERPRQGCRLAQSSTHKRRGYVRASAERKPPRSVRHLFPFPRSPRKLRRKLSGPDCPKRPLCRCRRQNQSQKHESPSLPPHGEPRTVTERFQLDWDFDSSPTSPNERRRRFVRYSPTSPEKKRPRPAEPDRSSRSHRRRSKSQRRDRRFDQSPPPARQAQSVSEKEGQFTVVKQSQRHRASSTDALRRHAAPPTPHYQRTPCLSPLPAATARTTSQHHRTHQLHAPDRGRPCPSRPRALGSPARTSRTSARTTFWWKWTRTATWGLSDCASARRPFKSSGRSTIPSHSAHVLYRRRGNGIEITVRRGVTDKELDTLMSKLSPRRGKGESFLPGRSPQEDCRSLAR